MRYFTPELFEQFNSHDEAIMLRAHRKWDQACDRYRASVTPWLDSASPGIRELAGDFCGHDGSVVASGHIGESIFYLFFVAELPEESVICYQLLGEPVITRHESTARCWEGDPLWLYDEVSRLGAGKYRHEILFGDGRILRIDFSDVAIRTWKMKKNGAARPRIELTMPKPEAQITTLSAAMKLWSARRPAVHQKRTKKRPSPSMAKSA